jgi:hypothetical protein
MVAKLVKKFRMFYGSKRFVAVNFNICIHYTPVSAKLSVPIMKP